MRKQNKIIAIFAGVMLIILQTITVFAESNTNTLSLKLAEYDKESRSVKVYCEMQAKDKVTNGKLRITYDSKQLKLVSSEKGNVLENGMCEINDCLTGNKKEGEIVAAFASAENLPEEGHLLEFSFEVNQSVKEEDSISVELKAEKLANEDADVQVNVENLTFTLKDGTVENPSDDSKKTIKKQEIRLRLRRKIIKIRHRRTVLVPVTLVVPVKVERHRNKIRLKLEMTQKSYRL